MLPLATEDRRAACARALSAFKAPAEPHKPVVFEFTRSGWAGGEQTVSYLDGRFSHLIEHHSNKLYRAENLWSHELEELDAQYAERLEAEAVKLSKKEAA